MANDGKLALFYVLIVAAMTLLYVSYEDIGQSEHSKAAITAPQADNDDE